MSFNNEINEKDKNAVLVGYAMQGLGMFTGIFWLAAIIWAYIKRGDAEDPRAKEHYRNQIRTFWIATGLGLACFILSFVFIGILLIPAVLIWTLFRIIKGVSRTIEHKGYYEVTN